MNNLLNRYKALAFGTIMSLAAIMGAHTAQAQYTNDQYDNGYYGDDYYQGNGYQSYDNDYMAFYNDLAPYGQWYRDPQYGMVWSPRVGRDFMPYQTNGYWMMTQYGNTWMSNYRWGWAAFHYGRWTYDSYYGWIWIPGREWGPAWVNWRSGGGYYGWAPLGPGINIGVSFNAPMNWWTFIPQAQIYYTGGYGRYYNGRNVYNIYNQTTIINNYNRYGGRNYVVGPSRGDVERSVRRSVRVYDLGERSSRGRSTINGTRVQMYRPDVDRVVRSTNANSINTRNVQVINRGSRNNVGQTRTPNNAVRTAPTQNQHNNGNRYDRGSRVQTPSGNRSVPNTNMNRSNNQATMPVRTTAPQRDVNNGNRNNQINRSTAPVRTTPAPQRQYQAPATRNTAPVRQQQRTSTPAPQRQYQAPATRSAAPQTRSNVRSNNAPARPAASSPARPNGNRSARPSGGNTERGYRR